MAYVPGYDYDVFVSYAHHDDKPDRGYETGWVTELVAGLRNQLAQDLGSEAIVWMDHEHRGHEPAPEILKRVRRCATMISVLSPSFMNSKWCQQELECFYETLQNHIHPRSDTRVFPVLPKEVEREKRPPKLQALPGYRFLFKDANGVLHRADWRKDHGGGWEYHCELDRLSRDLADELTAIKGPAPNPPESGPRVLLGEATDDVASHRSHALTYLRQASVMVLPSRGECLYSRSDQEFSEAFAEDLKQCHVFVQLLGAFPGRRPSDNAKLQYECARKAGKPVLQWQPPDLDIDAVFDDAHRRWLMELAEEGEDVYRISREEFLASVVREANAVSEWAEWPRQLCKVRLGPELDSPLIGAIRDTLRGVRDIRGARINTVASSHEPLAETLKYLHGLMFVYVEDGPEMERRILKYHDLLSTLEFPIPFRLYQRPQDNHEYLQVDLDGLRSIDGRRGLNTEALEEFTKEVWARSNLSSKGL